MEAGFRHGVPTNIAGPTPPLLAIHYTESEGDNGLAGQTTTNLTEILLLSNSPHTVYGGLV